MKRHRFPISENLYLYLSLVSDKRELETQFPISKNLYLTPVSDTCICQRFPISKNLYLSPVSDKRDASHRQTMSRRSSPKLPTSSDMCCSSTRLREQKFCVSAFKLWASTSFVCQYILFKICYIYDVGYGSPSLSKRMIFLNAHFWGYVNDPPPPPPV